MPEEQRARLREVDRLRNARGLRAEGSLTQVEEDTHDILTNIAIQRARAAALEYLHRTQLGVELPGNYREIPENSLVSRVFAPVRPLPQ